MGNTLQEEAIFLPKTIEDLELNAEITIDGVRHFFTDELKENFRKFINTIFYHSTIAEYFCYDTIYQSVLSELERTINNGNTKNTIEFHLTAISDLSHMKLRPALVLAYAQRFVPQSNPRFCAFLR